MNFVDHSNPVPILSVETGNLEALSQTLSPIQLKWLEATEFSGKLGQFRLLPDSHGNLGKVVFGVGNEDERKRGRLHFGHLASTLPKGNYMLQNTQPISVEKAALGWLLGQYQFSINSRAQSRKAELTAPENIDAQRLEHIAQGCTLAQDLINTPANVMTPEALSNAVAEVAKENSASFNQVVGDELLENNFPMIHAVGRASAVAPRLIEVNWGHENHPLVTIVGKGVCFDTGGLDLKPSSSMLLMKKDMGGSANALGLTQMIMKQKLPIRLKLLIPAVENAVSANAFRPSDVLISRSGKTVEVNNTDAEGRLVLADALTYASEHNPQFMLSLATLTGAARVAVGPDLAPYFSNETDFNSALEEGAIALEDPVWRLPFWDGYENKIEPDIADLDNAPAGGFAGATTAALFLRRFTNHNPYAHFDIYGWNPTPIPGRPKGGAAQGIRAIFHAFESIYK